MYIIFESKSDLHPIKAKSDTLQIEYYNISWPSRCEYKNLGISRNKDGQLFTTTTMSSGTNSFRLDYINRNNDNPTTEVIAKDLPGRFLIRFDDFIFYDTKELIKTLLEAKNLYVLFEDEKKNNTNFARKVTVTKLPQL
ncbi:MAG: hypothetical protein EOO48_01535 [Flavobacterium sp.]|nr:MAG: hypothetical protein EOO48_01535 [Flavobacterium sp.]